MHFEWNFKGVEGSYNVPVALPDYHRIKKTPTHAQYAHIEIAVEIKTVR